MGVNKKGDSAFRARLLAYLKQNGIEPQKIEKIRNNVFKIQAKRKTFFIKGFSNKRKYQIQRSFTKLVKEHGFHKTYSFLFSLTPLEYQGSHFALLEYLKPHKDVFRFHSRTDREEGLALLGELHKASGKVLGDKRFSFSIPRYNQSAKWTERLEEFKKITHIVAEYVPPSIIKRVIAWAEWSLAGLKENETRLYDQPEVITHGDVAYHNFLRVESGELYLIDWDLLSKSPAITDYLQYANRILPAISYSLEELWSYHAFKKLQENPAFLYGLCYPTDILREWNRLARDHKILSQHHIHSVWKLTVEDFEQRSRFQRRLARQIKYLESKISP
ncbi:phosphotransferase [Peribacillus sp. SCS-26]|uniref:phosphotransferase n=1 Tax=Paraperibacillus marinus TaxID=3115295 RepID=UPI0039065150